MAVSRPIRENRWALIVSLGGVVAILWMVYALRAVLLPFALGVIFAYAVLPVFSWVERRIPVDCRFRELRRISLITVTYVIVVGMLGLLGMALFFSLRDSFIALGHSAPDYFASAVWRLQTWTESIRQLVPDEFRQQVDQFVLDAGNALFEALRRSAVNGVMSIPSVSSVLLGLATLPVFLFYLLKDWEKLGEGLHSRIPSWAASHVAATLSIFGMILGRYLRAQLVLGLVVGLATLVGLLAMGIKLAPILAVIAGVGELVPVIGPWIAGVTAVVVTLASAPDRVLLVFLLFLSIQLLENIFLVPRIHGGYMHIHPAIALAVLIVGTHIAGVAGLILAVPLTAAIIAVGRYVISVRQVRSDVSPGGDGGTISA